MPFSYDINLDDTSRAKRRRQSSQSIDTKALGSNLGALARGTAVFDPNAYDGDGDGVVQDSTPFERPAVLSNIVALSRGFASATGKWGNAYEGWTVDKTNEEIAEVAVPSNPSELLSYLAIHASTHGLPRIYDSVDDLLSQTRQSLLGVDFSPETVANTRKVLVDTLNDNPQMRELIDKFGIPPVVARMNKPNVVGAMTQHMLMFLSKEAVDEHADSELPKWLKTNMKSTFDTSFFTNKFGEGIENLLEMLPNYIADNKPKMESAFIHEYGHYLVSYASYNHPDPDVREMLYMVNNSPWKFLSDIDYINRYDLPEEWYDLATLITNGYNDIDPDDEYNIDDYVKPNGIVPPSKYAITSPSEMIAELFTESVLDPRSDGNPEIVQTITGTSTRGFASTTGTTTNNFLLDMMTPERIAEEAVPDTPEKALEVLEEWSKWHIDIMGVDYGDTDLEGLPPKERVQVELKRALYYIGKHKTKGSKWKKSLRQARRHKGDVDPSEVYDFSEEAINNARASLAMALREQPLFLEHVKKFGIPPVLVSRQTDIDVGAYFNGSTGSMYILLNKKLTYDPNEKFEGEIAQTGLEGTEWFLESNGNSKPGSVFSHEYGHFLNYLSYIGHPDREARYLAGWYWQMSWDDVNPKGIKGWKYRKKWEKFRRDNPSIPMDRADTRYRQSAELEKAIGNREKLDWADGPPHVMSQYGQSSPAEMFAEGYSAYVSNEQERIDRVSPALVSDLELIINRAVKPPVNELIVDTSQNEPRNTGFASLSITRDADGTRDMAKAFSGEDDSPLKGVDWLKDATPREIAQALVPRSREDLVNLSLQHMLMGNTNPDPHVLAAVKEYIETVIDHDLFDFSPEGIAMMEDWLEKALNESPQFLWTVRRFGSSPIIPTDRNAVQKYRDARRAGQTIPIPSTGTRRNPMTYPIAPTDATDEQTMSVSFDSIVESEGVLGFNFAGLFTVINLHHREWRGLFRDDKQMPKFGRTRRVSMGRPRRGETTPYPETDLLGRDLISNFSTSLEGTIIHEYNHQFWSSLFGIKNALGIAPKMRERVARVAGLNRRDLEALSGDRKSRAAYLFPNLSTNDALSRLNYARENLGRSSLSIIPQPQRGFNTFREIARLKAIATHGDASPELIDIMSRIDDYEAEIIQRAKDRIANNPEMGPLWLENNMMFSGLDKDNPVHVAAFIWRYGWDPVEMENTWRGLAEDYQFVFGAPVMPFAGLAGLYAQTNPQETWAEMGAIMSQPDADYRDEYITPEMTASYLYILGEHDDPFSTANMVKPWEMPENRSGFASRSQRVETARNTVTKRASNALGNVISAKEPIEVSARRASIKKGSEGHTYFSLGDYKFKIPGDRFMPDISNSYTEWASDSHYDMQHISRTIMGLNTPSERPSFLHGRMGIARLINNGNVSELDENTLTDLRSSASRAKRIMDEIRDSETYSSVPLYHTMTRLGDKNELLTLEVGDTVHMPLTSFSPVITPAELIDTRPGFDYGGENSALIKLAIGASVFDSNLLENVSHDGEWRDMPMESITGGRFKVVSRTERNGVPLIEVEHTDVFDADKGEFVNIDPSESMSSVKEMVSIDRGMRELEKLHKRRNLIDVSDPEHKKLTSEIDDRAKTVVDTMFGDIPEPTMNLSREARRELIEEIEIVKAMPISSMDKVGLPGFASTSRDMGFDRVITPERRVAKSAIRTLEENREYIEERMMLGRTGAVLDGQWIDQTIERLKRGEITHKDSSDLLLLLMDIVIDRIRRDPSVRDATDGDVYHYQKLGKRLRKEMLNGLTDEDLAQIREESGTQRRISKPRGFASSSPRVRGDMVGRFSPTTLRGKPYGGEEWGADEDSKNVPEVIVYNINGEKVVFGVESRHKIDISDAKNIPLNPYDISGLERGSEEGEKLALDWAYAHIGSGTSDDETSDSNSTEISALLYAATQGDEDARREFDKHAAEGKKILDQARQKQIDETREDAEEIRKSLVFKESLNVMKRTLLYFKKKKETPDNTYIEEGEAEKTEITTKDIVLVRWTRFKPEYDEKGNLILGTPSDYIDVDRETIHFTLNHAVEEHMFWQEGNEGGYLIMIPLSDVIEDNGVESIGNLYGVDTYFTPKPGEGLKLRKDSVVVKEVKPGEDRKQITYKMLEEDFGTFGVRAGPHYVDNQGFDDLITTLSADLGIVRGALHGERGQIRLERINNRSSQLGDDMARLDPLVNNFGVDITVYDIADIDTNTLLRHIDRRHGKPTGVFIRRISNPKIQSFVSTSRGKTRDLSKDIKDPETADLVKKVQRNTGFASRSDAVNPEGKTVEDIAKELELTDVEKDMLSRLIPDYEELKKLVVNTAITEEQRQNIIDSVRVRVEDGVPFITTAPNPMVIDEIPDKRDWSTVLAPDGERQSEIRELLEKIGENVAIDDRQTIDQAGSEVQLNVVAFSDWLMKKWRAIGDKHPVPLEDSNMGSSIYGGGYVPTGFTIYFKSLFELNATGLLDFFGEDDFLNAHDLWGHAAIGRGFDRHGEWANMLAIFSMMDRWSKENEIPESDILKMKAQWFANLEYVRLGGRFVRGRDETSPNSERSWFERERGIWDALSGMATDSEIKELIGLLDHGRVHDSANSKGFASATRDERASIVASDIVRQSRRLAEMDLPVKGEETSEAIIREMGLTGQAAMIAREAFQRSLEAISSGRLKRYKFAKGVDEHKSRIIDSIRIVISADDVPMIMADPHPVFFRLLNDRRNWSLIEVPSDATVSEFIKKLKEGNNPLSYRERGEQSDASSGIEKFSKWAGEKIMSLGESASKQETPNEDIDEELWTFRGQSSWVELFVGSLVDGKNATGGAQDVFDMLHEAIGHVAIGRGFDRHGEYANGLAMLSMLKHPEVRALMTDDEIQKVARHIMTNYLVDRLDQARPEAVRTMFKATDGGSAVAQLMRLVREYKGDIWELVDILEREVDKTPAFRADGSPIEPRPKGFASQNRSTLDNATGQDLARVVNADAKHLGFASKATDFSTNTHGVEVDIKAPEADLFTADEDGRIAQVLVPVGVEVVNPRTGQRMILDSPSASIEFAADGGNLSEVPDDHLNSAILENAEDVPGERRSGWRFSKPGGRFQWVGGGGGATGMMRIRDKKTNLLFGIKFEASFMSPEDDKYGEWTMPFPITDANAADAPEGIINEVVGQALLQALGFEPGPTRIVKRSPRGAGDKNGGAAMIVEFAQNRHARTRDADDYAPKKVRRESAIRMLLLDAVLVNGDRNENNFLTSIQSDGSRVIVPIDHGDIMYIRENGKDLYGAVSSQFAYNKIGYETILGDMTKEELIAIMPRILADYRIDMEQKKEAIIKSMDEAIDKLISLHKEGDWPDREYLENLYSVYKNKINGVFSRLDEISSMSDEEFLELFKYLRIGYR